MATNEELVARFQDGEESAFNELLHKNRWLVFKMVRKFSRHAEQECSEDLEQVGNLALWRAAKSFDMEGSGQFLSYAWSAVSRACKNEIDSHQTIYKSSSGWATETEKTKSQKRAAKRIFRIDQQDADDGPVVELQCHRDSATPESKESSAALEWAVSLLPEREQRMQRMRLAGVRLDEIAKVESVSTARAQQICAKTVLAVKALVDAKYGVRRGQVLSEGERAYANIARKYCKVGTIARRLRRSHATIKSLFSRKGYGADTKRFAWHDDHKSFLAANRHRGWQWCASQLGTTLTSVRSQARRWGLSRQHLTSFASLRRLYDQGFTTREIGERLGVSDECIRVHLIRMGLDRTGYNARWRASQKRRGHAGKLATIKKSLYRHRANELGFPGHKYHHAVCLAALQRIGSGGRDEVAAACEAICTERGWKKSYKNGLSILPYMTELTRRGLIRTEGKGNQRRTFSLTSAATDAMAS